MFAAGDWSAWFVFAFITAQGARMGDVILAVNALLMNFQLFLSYALDGIAYSAEALPRVPTNLSDAIAAFDRSSLVREAFGEEVVEHLLHFARSEQRVYDKAVTDFERARFFERI